jgi:CRP/FNR family transcriptional regulator
MMSPSTRDCPDEITLTRYIRGDLGPVHRFAVERHLDCCPCCLLVVITCMRKESEMQSDLGLAQSWLENPIFAALGEQACRRLAAGYPPTVHPPGARLVEAGDPGDRIYVLLQGTVRMFHRAADGREAVTRLLTAPMMFGDAEALAGLPMLQHVAAVDSVVLAAVPARRYREMLRFSPAALHAHVVHLSRTLCLAARRERQVFTSLEQRVANLLVSHAECLGVQRSEGVEVRLSSMEIARSLGTIRRSVAKVIATLRREGLVKRVGSRIVLLRPDVLEAKAATIHGGLWHTMNAPIHHVSREDCLDEATLELLDGPTHVTGQIEVGDRLELGIDRLPLSGAAERHCRIYRGSTGRRFWIEDLDGLSTWVNGRQVHRAVLRDGDLIRVGRQDLRFHLRRGGRPAAPAARSSANIVSNRPPRRTTIPPDARPADRSLPSRARHGGAGDVRDIS